MDQEQLRLGRSSCRHGSYDEEESWRCVCKISPSPYLNLIAASFRCGERTAEDLRHNQRSCGGCVRSAYADQHASLFDAVWCRGEGCGFDQGFALNGLFLDMDSIFIHMLTLNSYFSLVLYTLFRCRLFFISNVYNVFSLHTQSFDTVPPLLRTILFFACISCRQRVTCKLSTFEI